MENILNNIWEWLAKNGLKIVIAVVLMIICFKVINWFAKKLTKKYESNEKYDKTLTKTLVYIGKIILKILVVVCLIGFVGIETGGISALIASLGVSIGLAVNGTLSNFAGGLMLLFSRPFKVDDYIQCLGSEGKVEDIKITYTKIITNDNKVVYLPNGKLSTDTIINYTDKDLRRVDLDFSVAGNDPVLVRNILFEVCKRADLILDDPEPFARITDFGAGNGLKVTLRAWCKSSDYWDAYYNLLDGAKVLFDENKIVVPFNQLDVHIKND